MVVGKHKEAECIRSISNWSHIEKSHLFDTNEFNPKSVSKLLPTAAPKLDALIKNIKEIDERDHKKYGKQFKHMIFTDIHNAKYGVKIIGSALIANGFHHIYDNKFKLDTETHKKGTNFAVLCSTTIFKKPLKAKLRKQLLGIFNERPENTHGEKLRIIVLDHGFKEGIDLFDVKYVHLFEPLLTHTDERQAIGRATRYCGQKGLRFDPQLGWQLHVYRYDVGFLNKNITMHEAYVEASGLDFRRLVFANELQNVCKEAAVDYELNLPIHEFDITLESKSRTPISINDIEFSIESSKPKKTKIKGKTIGGGKIKKFHPKPPIKKKSFQGMRKYIIERFGKYKWPSALMENQCKPAEEKSGGNISVNNFTPSQNFVRQYFDPRSAYKGLLAWHGVGVGKTCTAIATATTGFEPRNYTILWVTRHTLKADIWKNMFDTICSISLQLKVRDGFEIPEDAKKHPRKYLTNKWMMPISYKQFSNALAGKNSIYKELVKRNGAEDPLRNTLLIIDEAHKLYATNMKSTEKPNTDLITKSIMESYEKSKEASVRLLLLTATPYTNDPMDLIKLLNLMRDPMIDGHLPNDFDMFEEKYLNDKGIFSNHGKKDFMDDIAGYISYLNRERDARQFAYPVFHSRNVGITTSKISEQEEIVVETINHIHKVKTTIAESKEKINDAKVRVKDELAEAIAKCKPIKPIKDRDECKEKAKKASNKFKDQLLGDLEQKMKELNVKLITGKEDLKESKKYLNEIKKTDMSQEAKLIKRCKVIMPTVI